MIKSDNIYRNWTKK